MPVIYRSVLLLVALALFGFAILALEHLGAAERQRELLQNNFTYIELERHVREASANQRLATLAAAGEARLSADAVRAIVGRFVDSARAAAKANSVTALDIQFDPVLASANAAEQAVTGAEIDGANLRATLQSAREALDLLVLVAGDGRQAEMSNFAQGRMADTTLPMALIAGYSLFVAAVGFLAVRLIVWKMRLASAKPPEGHKGAGPATARFRLFGRTWSAEPVLHVVSIAVAIAFLGVAGNNALPSRVAGLVPGLGKSSVEEGVDAAYGAYQNGDFAEALRLSRPHADQGDVRAQTLLGLMYYHGNGVQRDFAEARNWLVRASDRGDAEAPFVLAGMYFDGRGVPQDFVEAARWYRIAAERRNARAQYNLGVMHLNGRGVEKSKVYAHLWFNLAAASFPEGDNANRGAAARNRDLVGRDMTRDELAEAQKLAREWRPARR